MGPEGRVLRIVGGIMAEEEKKRVQKRGGPSRKQVILDMATIFFADKGFRNTAIGEIARMAGVADGTIFYHYKTKEDLFVAVLANFKELLLGESREYLAAHCFADGMEMVEGLLSFYLQLAAKMEERFLLLHRYYPYRLALDNPRCREHLEAIYAFFVELFEQAIKRGQEDGSIRQLSSRKTGLLLYTLVDGLVRLDTFKLYQAGTLHGELIEFARNMLAVENPCDCSVAAAGMQT